MSKYLLVRNKKNKPQKVKVCFSKHPDKWYDSLIDAHGGLEQMRNIHGELYDYHIVEVIA